MTQRPDGRTPDELRPITIQTQRSLHAQGSALVLWGQTHVWCTATIEETVPPFLRGKKRGWVTAEYAMLPAATNTRSHRRASLDSGRTREISRMVGRALRAIIDLEGLGERQIRIDCDVMNADGGTRIASVIGGHVALRLAVGKLVASRSIKVSPFTGFLSAISVGIWRDSVVFDLCYREDVDCIVDGTLVADESGSFIEMQFTAEDGRLNPDQLATITQRAPAIIAQVDRVQRQALEDSSTHGV